MLFGAIDNRFHTSVYFLGAFGAPVGAHPVGGVPGAGFVNFDFTASQIGPRYTQAPPIATKTTQPHKIRSQAIPAPQLTPSLTRPHAFRAKLGDKESIQDSIICKRRVISAIL